MNFVTFTDQDTTISYVYAKNSKYNEHRVETYANGEFFTDKDYPTKQEALDFIATQARIQGAAVVAPTSLTFRDSNPSGDIEEYVEFLPMLASYRVTNATSVDFALFYKNGKVILAMWDGNAWFCLDQNETGIWSKIKKVKGNAVKRVPIQWAY